MISAVEARLKAIITNYELWEEMMDIQNIINERIVNGELYCKLNYKIDDKIKVYLVMVGYTVEEDTSREVNAYSLIRW